MRNIHARPPYWIKHWRNLLPGNLSKIKVLHICEPSVFRQAFPTGITIGRVNEKETQMRCKTKRTFRNNLNTDKLISRKFIYHIHFTKKVENTE